MEDEISRMYLRAINEKQNIIIEQLSALSKIVANHLNLPIEEGESDINDVE